MDTKTANFIEKLNTITNNTVTLDSAYKNAKEKIHVKSRECGHSWELIPNNLIQRGTGKLCPTCNGTNCGRNKIWSSTELDILKNNYTTLSNSDILKLLPNRTIHAVSNKAIELGIQKQEGFFKYTLEEINTLVQLKYSNLEVIKYSDYGGANSVVKYSDCSHIKDNVSINSLLRPNNPSGYICRMCEPAVSALKTCEDINYRLESITGTVKCIEYTGKENNAVLQCKECMYVWRSLVSNIFKPGAMIHICKICNPGQQGISYKEKELVQFIKDNYNGWVLENDRLNLDGQELDIVIPDLGIAFEYNGLYWHSDQFKGRLYHLNKTKLLEENMDYQLIHINSDEWLNKQNIVKSRILNMLGKSQKIYARKCTIKEIGFPSQFLDINHIQGKGTPTSINLGLYLGDQLVAVMTFGKPRFSTSYDYELVRYCSLLNTTVVGGASKLFKYFNSKYLGSVVSYSDKRWSIGNLYLQLGFKFGHTSDPNYKYYRGNTSLSRYQCQKHKLAVLLGDQFDPSMTEYENMLNAGYYRVFDCGNDVWIYE